VRVVVFACVVAAALALEWYAVRIGLADAARRRFQGVGVFLGGALLAGVLAAVATLSAGESGGYGFVAFLVLLGVDLQLLIAYERNA
jgi:hypothetical protein